VNFWRLEDGGALGHPNLHLVNFDLTNLGAFIRLVQLTVRLKLTDGHAVWETLVPA